MGQGRQGSGCKSKRVKMKSIEEKLAANQLDRLAKHWSGMKGKRIQPTDAIKLSAMVAKFGKDELEQLAAKDIPFLSMAAINNLMIKHNYNATKIKSLMKEDTELLYDLYMFEDVDAGEYDYEGDMAKTQLVTISDAAEELHDMLEDDENMPEWCQNKITKAMDYLDSVRDYMLAKDTGEEPGDENPNESVNEKYKVGDTVKPTKGPHAGHPHEVIHDYGDGHYNIAPVGLAPSSIKYGLGAAKAHKKDLRKESLNMDEGILKPLNKDIKEAATPAMKKAGTELSAYAKKSGGIDKAAFLKAAAMLSSAQAGMSFIKFVKDQDTEVFEKIITVMSKHMGKQTVEKMFKVRIREDLAAKVRKEEVEQLDEKKGDLHLYNNEADARKKAKEVSGKVIKGTGKSTGKWAVKEEVEQLDELSPRTKASYYKKAKDQNKSTQKAYNKSVKSSPDKFFGQDDPKDQARAKTMDKRQKGMAMVKGRKYGQKYEDTNEVLDTPKAMQSYKNKAKASYSKAASSAAAKILRGKDKDGNRADHRPELKTMDKRKKGMTAADMVAVRRTFDNLRKEDNEATNPLQKRADANKKAIDTGFMKLSKSDYEKEKKRLSGEGAMKRIATTQSNKADRIGSGGSKGLNTFKKKPAKVDEKAPKVDPNKYAAHMAKNKKPKKMSSTQTSLAGIRKKIGEKLEVADGMGAWIDDFKQSDAPQFKGKNAKERRDMAIAAYLSAKKDSE